MPHLTLQHSDNVSTERMQFLCGQLRDALVATGHFPLAGIRVRAIPCAAFSIADSHPNNAFVDMIFRIGAGRTEADKKAAGERIVAVAEDFFRERLAEPYFALSLEVIEIDPVLSWKTNSIHPRLKGRP